MTVRAFVSSTSVVLLLWLLVSFFYQVPAERYPLPAMSHRAQNELTNHDLASVLAAVKQARSPVR